MALRPATFALLALGLSAGCAARGTRPMARVEPPPPRASALPTALEVVDRLNRNAEPLESLKATPSIYVRTTEESHSLNGRLAVQRPRDLKLELRSTSMGQVADIGSNDRGFWLWVSARRNRDGQTVYTGEYDSAEGGAAGLGMQPDWIIEALGLRVIPDDEARSMTIQSGSGTYAGTYLLTRTYQEAGRTLRKQTIVSASTRLVREQRLSAIDPDRETLLASALINEHMPVSLPGGTLSDPEPRTVQVPKELILTWYQPEKMQMTITMGGLKVNQEFDRAAFVEPEFLRRYAHVRVDEPTGLADETTIRETRPAPPTRIQLGEPTPDRDEAAARTGGNDPGVRNAPLPLAPDLEPGRAIGDELVRPGPPRAPEPPGLGAAAPIQGFQGFGELRRLR